MIIVLGIVGVVIACLVLGLIIKQAVQEAILEAREGYRIEDIVTEGVRHGIALADLDKEPQRR